MENFIPQHYQIQKTKNGHNEKVLVPFLKDLIFVRSTQEKIKEEKSKIPYLLYITKREGDRNRPIIVPDREMNNFIDAIKVFNENLIFLKPEEINLAQGVRVRIHGGIFDKREGIFIKLKGIRNRRVVISINGVVAVALSTIPVDYIEVIEQ